jgi:hypothetical protein
VTVEPSLESSIARCLDQGGATSARSPDDLMFLRRSESAEEAVSKNGLYYDRRTKQIVRQWNAATFERRPPEWTIWFGQSIENDLSPIELIEAQPAESFVMFVKQPSSQQRRLTDACLRFGSRSNGNIHFHPIHP